MNHLNLFAAAWVLLVLTGTGCSSGSHADTPSDQSAPLLTLVKTVNITSGGEGGSARPEIVAANGRLYAVYLGHFAGGASTRSFDVKIYNADLTSVVTATTIVSPSSAFGSPTDIRVARDGQNLFAFYETATVDTTFLHGAKYALNDSFDCVARGPEPIASAKPEFQAVDGDEVLNDPAPLVGPDSVFVVTRLRYSIAMNGKTVYRVREFSKDTMAQIRQFDLDLSDIADGRGRVTSLWWWNDAIFMALATTVSDQGVNESSDDGAQCDIILVTMKPDWTFDPATDVHTLSAEPDDRENYITGLRTDGTYFYLSYKQTVGTPPTGEHRAVIKIFDMAFHLLRKEVARTTPWGPDGGEIRPSLEISGGTLYSGQSTGATLGSGDAAVLVYSMQ